MFPPDPADKPMQFFKGIVRHLVRRKLAASGDHLLGGKPNPEIPELDQPSAVRPPQEAELLDGQKNKAPDRLTRIIRSVVHSGSVASLVWRRTESGRPHTP